MSQADLVRATGLSAAAVSGFVHELVEHGAATISSGVANGRRGRLVHRRVPDRLGAGIDIGRSHLRVVVGSGPHAVLEEVCVDLPARHDPDHALPVVRRVLEQACARAGTSLADLDGIGVSVPGPVDIVTGAVVGGPILSPWEGVIVRELVGSSLHHDAVAVDNDANAGTLALHAEFGSAQGLAYVKVGSGIGAGIMIGGLLLRGSGGTVGEIGHLNLDPSTAVVCRCGRRGCLETLSSTEAIRTALGSALGTDVSVDQAVDLILVDDPVATTILDEATVALGRGLAWLATIVNPHRIVIGGTLLRVGERALPGMGRGFRQSVLPQIAAGTSIELSPFGERTEALGALLTGLSATARR